jgi:predicted ATPase/DNA-binding CsgD family transcriptional regulator
MPSALDRLTDRELEVLGLMAAGLYNETIAARVFVSVKTVETIIRSIFKKLELDESDGRNRRVVAVTLYLEHAPIDGFRPLPDRLTTFVGRSSEIADLEHQLMESRVLSVVGVGGSGKTSLAVALAQRWLAAGRRVIFADLVAAQDRVSAFSAVWDAAGIIASSERAGLRRLRRVLNEGDTLLVLDNAEQISDEIAALIGDLGEIPRVCILVTSRSLLGAAWERAWPVPPLADVDADALLVDRVRVPVDSEQRRLLCRAADGLPLAIELLAARCDSLGPDAVIDRLETLDTLLARPGTGRHSSLAAIVESAHDALSPEAGRLFRALSVFPGGFTSGHLDVCTRIAGTDAVVLLDELLSGRLVERVGDNRYRMLEPTRNVATRLVDVHQERAETDSVLAQWSREFVRAHAWGFTEPDNSAWRTAMTQETANTDAAFAAALDRQDVELVLDLVGSLAYYWSRHRLLAGRERAMQALTLVPTDRPSRRAAWALLGVSLLDEDLERKQSNRRLARDWFRATGDVHGELVAGYQITEKGGDLEDLDQTIAIAQRLDARFFEGWLLIRKAARLYEAEAADEAVLEALRDAEHIGRIAENGQLLGGALLARCGWHLSREDSGPEVSERLDEGMELIEATGDPGLRINALCLRAALCLLRDEVQNAVTSAHEMTSACVDWTGDETTLTEQARVARVVITAAATLQHCGHATAASEVLRDVGDLISIIASGLSVNDAYPIAPSILAHLPLATTRSRTDALASALSQANASLASVSDGLASAHADVHDAL